MPIFFEKYEFSQMQKWMFPFVSPCATKHWSQASAEHSFWHAASHRVIALFEFIPLLGPVISLVELFASNFFRDRPPSPPHVVPSASPLKKTQKFDPISFPGFMSTYL